MAVTRQFTGKPLQYDDVPEKLDRIRAIADADGVSQAQVLRDIVDDGIDAREARSKLRRGRRRQR